MIRFPFAHLALAALLATLAFPPLARADIVIAVAGPASGEGERRMHALRAAADAAVRDINGRGGVLGQSLTVISTDDGCAADLAATSAHTLAAQKPALVLGHPCASAAVAAADVYASESILFIATATRHPQLTVKRAGPTIFRLAGRDDRQGAAAAHLIARDFKGEKVALVQDRTLYARSIFDQAMAELKDRNFPEPITAAIIAGDKEYKATAAKTKDAAALLFLGFPLEAGFLHAALRAAGSSTRVIGSDSLVTDEFAATFGGDVSGIWALSAPIPADDANADGRDTGGRSTDGRNGALDETARTAAAIAIFADAANQAGSTQAAAVADVIARTEFLTEIGPVSFDAAGDARIPSFEVLEWDGEKWRHIGATPP